MAQNGQPTATLQNADRANGASQHGTVHVMCIHTMLHAVVVGSRRGVRRYPR